MNALVYLPLLVPVLTAAAARSLAARLEPRLATWLLTAATVALAAFSTAALALMAASALARAPVLAALGDYSQPALRRGDPVPALAGIAAALLLTAAAVAVAVLGVSVAAWLLLRLELRDEVAGDLGQQADSLALYHDPAGRAGQRVGLDGVAGHHDDASARGHAGGAPVRLGQGAGAGADHHRDRHRGRGEQQGRGHPGQRGDGVTAAEYRPRVVAQRGQERRPGERRGGHQGQRGRAERGERDRGRGQQPGRQARLQPGRQRPGGRRRQHGNQQRQVDERAHPS